MKKIQFFTTNGLVNYPLQPNSSVQFKHFMPLKDYNGPSLEEIHSFFEKVAQEESVDIRDLRLFGDAWKYSVYLQTFESSATKS